jgi:hypothetical protein
MLEMFDPFIFQALLFAVLLVVTMDLTRLFLRLAWRMLGGKDEDFE